MKQYKRSKTDKVPKTSRSPKPGLNQKDKSKFRSSTEWKDFRLQKIEESENKCDCCGRYFKSPKLHCHHKNLDRTKYTDISDKTHFSVLCTLCHGTLHSFHGLATSKKSPTTNNLIIELQSKFFI